MGAGVVTVVVDTVAVVVDAVCAGATGAGVGTGAGAGVGIAGYTVGAGIACVVAIPVV